MILASDLLFRQRQPATFLTYAEDGFWPKRDARESATRCTRMDMSAGIIHEPFAGLADSSTMTTFTDYHPPRAIAHSQTGYFYFYMALACTAVAFIGFAPTYWMPLAKRSFRPHPSSTFTGCCSS